MDIKGILLYLVPTLVLGYVLAIGGYSLGLLTHETPSILHLLLMVVLLNLPALFAFLAGQFSARGPVLLNLFPLPRLAMVRAVLVVGVAFVGANLIAAAFGLTTIDWRLGSVLNKIQDGNTTLTPQQLAVVPAFLLVFSTLFTLVIGASAVAAIVLGQVYAWHGFLQDRLAPLGRFKAAAVGGALWALWFAPFIYYRVQVTGAFESDGLLGRIYHLPVGGLILAIALTILLREAVLRSQGLALPAVILGTFMAHHMNGTTTIWGSVFTIQTPPWTGAFGVFSVLVWALLAAFPGIMLGATAAGSTLPSDAKTAQA